jgi:hypothetical protein
MTSLFTKRALVGDAFDNLGVSEVRGGCRDMVGGAESEPDMILERDMGSARGGGGAC